MAPTPAKREMGTAAKASFTIFTAAVILLSTNLPGAKCQDDANNPGVNEFITSVIYSKLSNLTGTFAGDIGNRLGFCIKDKYAMQPLTFLQIAYR